MCPRVLSVAGVLAAVPNTDTVAATRLTRLTRRERGSVFLTVPHAVVDVAALDTMSCMVAPVSARHALSHRAVQTAQHIAAARFTYVQQEHAQLEVPLAAAAGSVYSTGAVPVRTAAAVAFNS